MTDTPSSADTATRSSEPSQTGVPVDFQPVSPGSRYDELFTNRGSDTLDFSREFEVHLKPQDSTRNLRNRVEMYYVWVTLGDEGAAKLGTVTSGPDEEHWRVSRRTRRIGRGYYEDVGSRADLGTAVRHLINSSIVAALSSDSTDTLRRTKTELERALERIEDEDQ